MVTYASSVLRRLIPKPVGIGVVRIAASTYALFPEEASAVAHAVPARREEFSAGRHCARVAMAELGHAESPIPANVDRSPRWPAGLVGSISHSAGLCVAVVARYGDLSSVGIDTEPCGAVPASLRADILREDESATFDRLAARTGCDSQTLAFCIKEAAFKAFSPRLHGFLSFKDIRIVPRREAGAFSALIRVGPRNAISTVPGKCAIDRERVFVACWNDEAAR